MMTTINNMLTAEHSPLIMTLARQVLLTRKVKVYRLWVTPGFPTCVSMLLFLLSLNIYAAGHWVSLISSRYARHDAAERFTICSLVLLKLRVAHDGFQDCSSVHSSMTWLHESNESTSKQPKIQVTIALTWRPIIVRNKLEHINCGSQRLRHFDT